MGQMTPPAYKPTDVHCSRRWLLNEQLMSVSHWPADVSCSLAYFVDCSLADGCQLLIGNFMSDAHKPTDVSCFLTYLFQLLIGKLMSAVNWPSDVSCLLEK